MLKSPRTIRLALLLGGLLVLAVLPLLVTNRFVQSTVILILMYGTMAQAWNIMGGYTGLISIGQVAFFGLGGYVSSFLQVKYGVNPWPGMLIGGLVTALFGVLVGLPVSRLRGRYFSIATMAMAEVMRISISNWEFVGGARGITLPIMHESWLNFQFHRTKVPYYYIILGIFLAVNLVLYWLERSRTGYYFRAVRENEDVAEGLGIDKRVYKLTAIAIAAFFTALCGSFLAQYSLYVEPDYVFNTSISITTAMIAVFGGIGSLAGPILGASVLVPLSEYSRALLGSSGRGLDLAIYGLLIMIFCIAEPGGLMGLWRRLRKRYKAGRQARLQKGGTKDL